MSYNTLFHPKNLNVLYPQLIYFDLSKVKDFKGKKEGKDQESIQSSTTHAPGYQWECDNFTIRHHEREPRGQPFPSR